MSFHHWAFTESLHISSNLKLILNLKMITYKESKKISQIYKCYSNWHILVQPIYVWNSLVVHIILLHFVSNWNIKCISFKIIVLAYLLKAIKITNNYSKNFVQNFQKFIEYYFKFVYLCSKYYKICTNVLKSICFKRFKIFS